MAHLIRGQVFQSQVPPYPEHCRRIPDLNRLRPTIALKATIIEAR